MPFMLAFYVHNLNSFVFRIGGWGPRWYGLAYLMGFLGAYLLLKKQARDGMLRLKPVLVTDLVLNCCIFGVLLGGRLGYCLFYQPSLLAFDSQFPFWGVLRVWEGGMSAHGGVVFTILTLMVFAWRQYAKPTAAQMALLIGGAIALGAAGWAGAYLVHQEQAVRATAAIILGMAWLTFYAWYEGIPVTNIGDAACMVVPIGLFFGRCANFINGELYGHATTVPWAVKFPSEVASPTNGVMDPSVREQLPKIFTDLKLPIDWFQQDTVMDQGLAALRRLLAEHDPQAVQAVANIIPARHPSQLYEALLEGLLLFLICYIIGRKWKKDGMASGAFLTFYPIMRIIGEQFRVGDTPMSIGGVQISKGVLYSIPMVLAGILYWGYWMWRDRPAVWVPALDEPGDKQSTQASPTRVKSDTTTQPKQG
jgi:phosphatidylglycerol---prolipoprotein diacylglyceryl transferase